jgi:hypothetical protein
MIRPRAKPNSGGKRAIKAETKRTHLISSLTGWVDKTGQPSLPTVMCSVVAGPNNATVALAELPTTSLIFHGGEPNFELKRPLATTRVRLTLFFSAGGKG